MEHPEHQILQVGNQPNDHEDNHVHVPLEPESQHYVRVVEGPGFYFQLVREITAALHVQAVVHGARNHFFGFGGLLVVLQGQLYVQWVHVAGVGALRLVDLALHQVILIELLVDGIVAVLHLALRDREHNTARIQIDPVGELAGHSRYLVYDAFPLDVAGVGQGS